ncbi:ATP-binding protein [Nocardioides sp. S5]|uniref:ATP-binding protein n=1 Tax=Nocardioides sp. S5 TaxID=2017486 RepID=UPI001A8D1622|nr:ATP-binding protein [Nocardioides sp. S5]
MNGAAGPGPAVAGPTHAWAEQSLDALTSLPDVRRAGIALPEGGGRRLNFTSAEHSGQRPVTWCQVDAYDDVPLNTAVRNGTAVVGSLEQLEDSHPDFVERQRGTETLALAAVPLVADGHTLGAFVLFYRRPPEFADAAVRDLADLGARLGETLRSTRATHTDDPDARMRTPPTGARVALFAVASDPAAVGPARHELSATLSGWNVDRGIAETAALCMSELVTNAVVHADSGCHVQVTWGAGTLTVEVRNPGNPPDLPEPDLSDPFQVHGRGLQLVDALASQWGSDRDPDGFSAWFTLES